MVADADEQGQMSTELGGVGQQNESMFRWRGMSLRQSASKFEKVSNIVMEGEDCRWARVVPSG